MSRLPDFIILGAARAGTTALHSYLRQSPQIFMPEGKEPNFFAYEGARLAVRGPGADFINNSITDLDVYLKLFEPAPPGAILGEASPLYLYEPAAPGNIHRRIPGARLVVILRNPIEQAFSHFLYAKRMSVEPLASFTEALGREDERARAGWQPLFGYSRFARFGEQLERYLALFPREQILIRTYDEFRATPETLIAAILAHVGADPTFRPDMSLRPNEGGVPKSAVWQKFLMRPNPITGLTRLMLPERTRRAIRDRLAARNLRRARDRLAPEARMILSERLSDDIARLGTLTGLDFSHWLQEPGAEPAP